MIEKNKNKKLHPFSFVVQVLIFQIWMSFNNDGQYDYKGKYDNGSKIILKVLKNQLHQQL